MTSIILALLFGSASLLGGGVAYLRTRKRRGRRLYRQSLERALADGILTAEETAELAVVREQRDLSDAEVRMVALSLYRRALRNAVADARITEQENAELQQLRTHLGLSERDLRGDEAQLQRIRIMAEVERGHLPHIDAPVELGSGEECHWVIQGRLADRLNAPGRRSELRGLRFDVADKTPFSAAGERSALGPSPEILPSDLGAVLVTNRRTLFQGARRSVSVPHMKLGTLELFQDGIALDESDPARRSFFMVDDPELTAAILLCAARLRRRDLSGLSTRSA